MSAETPVTERLESRSHGVTESRSRGVAAGTGIVGCLTNNSLACTMLRYWLGGNVQHSILTIYTNNTAVS